MAVSLAPEIFSEVVGAIYDCAIDREAWPNALTRLREAMGFHNAALALQALPSGEVLLNVTSGIPADYLARMPHYGADVVEQWGGVEAMRSYPLYEPLVLSWIRERSLWEGNRYYNEWGLPQGLVDGMGIGVARDPASVGSLGLGRHRDAGPITEREVELARLFIPHLQRAVTISRILDIKTVSVVTLETVLDTVAAAVILVDANLAIVHANRAALKLFAAGGPIASVSGRLQVSVPAAAAALRLAVAQAVADEAALDGKGLGIPLSRDGEKPRLLYVLPLGHSELRASLVPRAVAAIFVAPPFSPPAKPHAALAALFGLSGAESAVLGCIVAGRSVKETAESLGIEISTVKTHLHRIFQKTDTRRQAELVSLAASYALPIEE
ncbi:helix-turn-helix transcriptional regulator [Chelativorans sp.]|uniref:helix-turn-helix transcriptional regulator n=1 Tax=Chelativorans sp. TaxID=2203393 RepID=UPI002812814D|nr:helix-turn-helix transcriptional regulator [Chelativorans sp.]